MLLCLRGKNASARALADNEGHLAARNRAKTAKEETVSVSMAIIPIVPLVTPGA